MDHMVVLFLISWGSFMLSSIVAAPTYSHQQCISIFFSSHPRRNLLFLIFLFKSEYIFIDFRERRREREKRWLAATPQTIHALPGIEPETYVCALTWNQPSTFWCVGQHFNLLKHPTRAIPYLFNNSHSDEYEVRSHCGFDLHFPNDYWRWASFHVLVSHLYVFLGKMSIQFLCPFLSLIGVCLVFFIFIYLFLLLSYMNSLYFGH